MTAIEDNPSVRCRLVRACGLGYGLIGHPQQVVTVGVMRPLSKCSHYNLVSRFSPFGVQNVLLHYEQLPDGAELSLDVFLSFPLVLFPMTYALIDWLFSLYSSTCLAPIEYTMRMSYFLFHRSVQHLPSLYLFQLDAVRMTILSALILSQFLRYIFKDNLHILELSVCGQGGNTVCHVERVILGIGSLYLTAIHTFILCSTWLKAPLPFCELVAG